MERLIDQNEALAQVRADGTTTRYRRAGTGRPVLLLCDVADERFAIVLRRLAERRRVIAPERDAGGSGVRGSELQEGDEGWIPVERLVAFLDGLGVGPVPVVGIGRAAGPAAALARLHPDRVDRLVLLGEEHGEAAGHAEAALAALERGSD